MIEICPNCGNDTDEGLDELTGWCKNCSPNRCVRCNKISKKALCNSCQRIKYLEDHADELEELQRSGMTVREARDAINEKNRPICLVCQQPIFYASKDAIFCTRNKECRQARRRYRTLRTGKYHLPSQIAIEQVLRELND